MKGTLRLSGATSGYVGLAPQAAAGSTTYNLPTTDGTARQALTTNGSGTLSWASVPTIVATFSQTNFAATNQNILLASAPTGLFRITAYAYNSTAASSGAGCNLNVWYFFAVDGSGSVGSSFASVTGTSNGRAQGTYTFYHGNSAQNIRLDTINGAGTCVGQLYRVDATLELLRAY